MTDLKRHVQEEHDVEKAQPQREQMQQGVTHGRKDRDFDETETSDNNQADGRPSQRPSSWAARSYSSAAPA